MENKRVVNSLTGQKAKIKMLFNKAMVADISQENANNLFVQIRKEVFDSGFSVDLNQSIIKTFEFYISEVKSIIIPKIGNDYSDQDEANLDFFISRITGLIDLSHLR